MEHPYWKWMIWGENPLFSETLIWFWWEQWEIGHFKTKRRVFIWCFYYVEFGVIFFEVKNTCFWSWLIWGLFGRCIDKPFLCRSFDEPTNLCHFVFWRNWRFVNNWWQFPDERSRESARSLEMTKRQPVFGQCSIKIFQTIVFGGKFCTDFVVRLWFTEGAPKVFVNYIHPKNETCPHLESRIHQSTIFLGDWPERPSFFG